MIVSNMAQKLCILLFCLSFIACKTKHNKTTPDAHTCLHKGKVQDFTGLDGCRLLIVLQDGRRLEPISHSETLKDQQTIMFNYEIVEDAMSICMAGKIVRLTCLEVMAD